MICQAREFAVTACGFAHAQIYKNKSIARHGFSALDRDRMLEHGSVINESMKLAVFPTRIDSGRKVLNQFLIHITPRK